MKYFHTQSHAYLTALLDCTYDKLSLNVSLIIINKLVNFNKYINIYIINTNIFSEQLINISDIDKFRNPFKLCNLPRPDLRYYKAGVIYQGLLSKVLFSFNFPLSILKKWEFCETKTSLQKKNSHFYFIESEN